MNCPQRTQGGSGNDRHHNPPPSIRLDDIRFSKGVDTNLFDKIAQRVARDIAEDGHWSKKKEGWKREKNLSKNKSAQLRKFYDELVMWHDKVFEHGVDRAAKYNELAPFIKMLCAKVTYAKGREHVGEGFERLFTHVIRAISDPETLKQAKLFIEAFTGFYKAEEKNHAETQ
ncbi:MAG: type III-A CRISPR-associated protein Csm2 [Zoogloeaceae bacterium]|jgi:CRISPR-associated protein Csm2|nr:type III-A CRISPR-associated protein Csm2 [Zoogloeaceae bacterium]